MEMSGEESLKRETPAISFDEERKFLCPSFEQPALGDLSKCFETPKDSEISSENPSFAPDPPLSPAKACPAPGPALAEPEPLSSSKTSAVPAKPEPVLSSSKASAVPAEPELSYDAPKFADLAAFFYPSHFSAPDRPLSPCKARPAPGPALAEPEPLSSSKTSAIPAEPEPVLSSSKASAVPTEPELSSDAPKFADLAAFFYPSHFSVPDRPVSPSKARPAPAEPVPLSSSKTSAVQAEPELSSDAPKFADPEDFFDPAEFSKRNTC